MKNESVPHIFRDGTFESQVEGSHVAFRHYTRSENPAKKVKHIILLHGALEYHKRHIPLIDFLIENYKEKVIVSCMDLVGHGYSGGARAYVDKFDSYEEDFLTFLKICGDLRHEREVESCHVIAHSLGGMIALKTLVDRGDQAGFPIDSMVLTNPCIKPKTQIPQFAGGAIGTLSSAAGKARIPSLYSGKDLTNDPKRAIAFDGDHLISDFVTTGLVNAIYQASLTIMPYSYYLKIPTLFVLSGKDKIVDNEATKLFIAGLDKSLAHTLHYTDAKHDILNETCAKAVFQEIIDYIDNKFSDDQTE